ncbi:N4-gp56 family major capsid protein [Salmonella enterica subsp. enterica serovar Florida]|uniref:N4-gp56 family major capsid protein n=3 Tax=Salmonella enterica I TaxID=59201 RepID=A0A5U8JGU1_SALET|nr:N4-gp56 family major capsid protein [Salmonella enterica]EBR7997164.1 N4-gp56 family major capsid protein [Salmonella enterica subsp. enterica serovar Panama]EBS4088715.1 N4-gp56 family major capsid protein [Salmonella enterica subsp. enterica serovar Newport]ECG3786981.1 N4-gp56 family major capsid protein [Salmonella enterica subsp. enterica serovar Florida]ASD87175.1 N4-gp56 family major capsid protein [Salmonella enterica subsp. enterica serovar India str. SA20085604]EBR8436539.1 N4-gp5
MSTVTTAQANKLYQVALFTAANRNRSMVNILTEQEEAPKAVSPDKKSTKQTSAGAPVVRITDLKKERGDEVSFSIMHKLSKLPTMGDQRIEGRGEDLSRADFTLRIDQGRHLVDAGGRMSQQRTKFNLVSSAKTLLGTYFNDLQDQCAVVHLAGARGDFMADDVIVPLASHHDFKEIMINDVMPPTHNRHFFGGDATSLEAVDSSDVFTLSLVDNMALYIDEMAHPLQPVRLKGDELYGEDPYYVLYVTPRQWNDWYTSTSGKDWNQMMVRAVNRSKGFNHPLFKGECAMWRNILVRKYAGIPIRFYTGSKVQVSNNDLAATTQQIEVKTNIDRAMLLGAQALANAYGQRNGGHFNLVQKKTDMDNRTEIAIDWINGLKKIRFEDKTGRMQDHGVIAVDTAVRL